MERVQKIVEHCVGSQFRHRAESVLTALNTSQQNEQFEFTLDGGILTLEQRRFYEENGFLVVKHLVSPEEISVYSSHFEQICNGKIKPLIGTYLVPPENFHVTLITPIVTVVFCDETILHIYVNTVFYSRTS
jgi:hypothetical protein